LLARGTIDGAGVMRAVAIQHARQSPKMWLPDR